MSPRPVPPELLPWALSVLGVAVKEPGPALTVVAGDASNRRYFRFGLAGQSYVLVESPPATEKNEAFLAVRELLARAGVKIPALHGSNLEHGFLLLEDLGDSLLLSVLDAVSVDAHYDSASALLLQMAALDVTKEGLPAYDQPLLAEELSRFPDWFVQALLDYAPDTRELSLYRELADKLIGNALEQPQVLVHRDFHSRNLMLQGDGGLAVIDFQDAVLGPVTYDLVSLLRDCYIRWPAERVRDWALAYRDRLYATGLLPLVDDALFLRWFDWMGLQRHIKVLGTFARLYLRDGKSAYLDDLPLVLDYVQQILDKYAGEEPVFAEFSTWFESRLSPLIAQQEWSMKL